MSSSAVCIKTELRQLVADKVVLLAIIVSALGYFVDIFDLLMFSIVRVQSLRDLGVDEGQILDVGVRLINIQMAGLLAGGLFWGMLGDKFGRISVLFGSIIMYSLANIGNGFVQSVEQYSILRFISGFGLAGELGLGVTLVSELLPRNMRGWGTALIAAVGVLGGTFAAVVADLTSWRTAYIIGGIMGLLLLALRIGVRESGLFKKAEQMQAQRGQLRTIFLNKALLKKYIKVILVGAPIWATVGLFITFTPEFARDFGMNEIPSAGTAVLFCYLAQPIGDLAAGFLCQKFRSRRKVIFGYLCALVVTTLIFMFWRTQSHNVYYFICALLGIATGYWAMFVQIGAEQFGTNIRATAATSIPNFVRGLVIPMTFGFHLLIPHLGVAGSGLAVMGVSLALAFLSLWRLEETFHVDLDYVDYDSRKGGL